MWARELVSDDDSLIRTENAETGQWIIKDVI